MADARKEANKNQVHALQNPALLHVKVLRSERSGLTPSLHMSWYFGSVVICLSNGNEPPEPAVWHVRIESVNLHQR